LEGTCLLKLLPKARVKGSLILKGFQALNFLGLLYLKFLRKVYGAGLNSYYFPGWVGIYFQFIIGRVSIKESFSRILGHLIFIRGWKMGFLIIAKRFLTFFGGITSF